MVFHSIILQHSDSKFLGQTMSNTREHKSIEVEKLTLDTENPRIQKIVEMYAGGITPEALGLALGSGLDDVDSREAGTTFYTLKAAIKTNGGIIQPIHVMKLRMAINL